MLEAIMITVNSDYYTNGYNDLIIKIIIIDGVYIYKDNDINIYNHYDNYNSLLPLRLQWLMSIMIITSSFIFYNDISTITIMITIIIMIIIITIIMI